MCTVFPRKEKKRKYCILNTEGQYSANHNLNFLRFSQSVCVLQVFSIFPPGEIRNREVKVRVTRRFCFFFFFFFLLKYYLFYCYYFIFSTTNSKAASKRHFSEKIFAQSEKSLSILLHQALQLLCEIHSNGSNV